VADIGGSFSFREEDTEGSGGGVPAGLPAGTPLPCLNSDNCIQTAVVSPLTAYGRKRAAAVLMNLEKFFSTGPLEWFTFQTMTFGRGVDLTQANKRFHSYWTNVLSEDFDQYIRILEGHKDGRAHFHSAVRSRGLDLRTGFNFAYHERCGEISKERIPESEKRKLRNKARAEFGDLGRNDELKRIHDKVALSREKYGVGRTEIVPVKTVEGLPKYMGKYLTKETVLQVDGRKHRIVTYSQGWQKAATARFNWNSKGAQLWRRKVECWAITHGCFSLEDLKSKFGPRWAWQYREAILNQPGTFSYRDGDCGGTESRRGPTVDELPVPPKSSCQSVARRVEPANPNDPDWSSV
jgi:hypothetical protein